MGIFSGLGSALVGGALSLVGARQQNKTSVDLANTSYQRAMADMKAAGLNPILAYKMGGASTPNIVNELGAGVQGATSALQAASSAELQSAQAGQAREQTRVSHAQVMKTYQEIENLAAQKNLTEEQTYQVANLIEHVKAQIGLTEAQTASELRRPGYISEQTQQVRLDNVQQGIMADFYSSTEFAKIAKDFGMNTSTLMSLMKAIIGGRR